MCAKIICHECLKKQEELDRLRDENQRLKAKIRYQDRKISEGFFASSTPSSKKPLKPNTSQEDTAKNRGGAKVGHKGNGRRSLNAQEADRVQEIAAPHCCPYCGNDDLQQLDERERTVTDIIVKVERVVYKLERKRCKSCKKVIQAKAPGVMPRHLYGNNLLAHVASEHYLNGISLGHLENQTGIGYGSLIQSMHNLADLLKDIPQKLIEEYRQAKVKHADETGWRNDGHNGYAWLFTSKDTAIYRFRKSRSGKIAQEIFGDSQLPGFLVVDRYKGYNKAPCLIQYCYAHLLRTIQDLEKEFPDNDEIKQFVATCAPLLAEAINLRVLPISDVDFYSRAAHIKAEIIKHMNSPANHAGIWNIQNIFRENEQRLYHWAYDRAVPADNNFAERELRPLVVARKMSFGSHSDEGAQTRETLMTVLKTLKLRSKGNVREVFKNFLDKFANDPAIDIYLSLFPPPKE